MFWFLIICYDSWYILQWWSISISIIQTLIYMKITRPPGWVCSNICKCQGLLLGSGPSTGRTRHQGRAGRDQLWTPQVYISLQASALRQQYGPPSLPPRRDTWLCTWVRRQHFPLAHGNRNKQNQVLFSIVPSTAYMQLLHSQHKVTQHSTRVI